MDNNIFILFIIITYLLEILLIYLVKEPLHFIMFVPIFHIVILICLLITFIDDLNINVNGIQYKIKKYRGYYYLTYNKKPILYYNTNLDFENFGGFWVPFGFDKLICFDSKREAINFIDQLEAENVFNKLI